MTLQEVANNVCNWLSIEHGLTGKIVKNAKIDESRPFVDIRITDGEGEDFYIGNFADPGLNLSDLRCLGDENNLGDYVVKANGIWISALGRHIAGWATGY